MKTYKSKIDLWLIVPFLFPVFFIVSGIVTRHYFSAGMVLVGLIFFADMFKRTDYTVMDDKLKIRSGIIVRKKIDINSIRKIEKTRSILSSPALSMDRIIIRYNKLDEIIVSPKEKHDFVSHLAAINPNIEISI